jgi:hypothetical protein
LKLGQVAIVVAIAGAALWIEHGHRIVTDAPTPTELDALAAARACPDNENMPYTTRCLAFLQGSAAAETRGGPNAPKRVLTEQPAAANNAELTSVSPRPACADNDSTPYSASCIAFMTGWFWRP